MKKQMVEFAVVTKNGVVTHIGHSVIYQPEIKFKGGTVKWVDDSKYMKKHQQEGYVYITRQKRSEYTVLILATNIFIDVGASIDRSNKQNIHNKSEDTE